MILKYLYIKYIKLSFFMKLIIKIFLLTFFLCNSSYAINDFKYLKDEITGETCKELYNNLSFPGFPKNQNNHLYLIQN